MSTSNFSSSRSSGPRSSGGERGGSRSFGSRSGGERSSSGGDRAGGARKQSFFRRRKTCPFSGEGAPKIDFKDVKLLSRFVSERGKMMPSRISAVSPKKQRELARAIKRARFLGLLPYAQI